MPTESPELIENRIFAMRMKLTDKVGELNDRTAGTVRDTVEKLTGTLDAATDTFEQVSQAVGQVRNFATVENLGRTLEDCVASIPLSKAVADRPWTAVAGAAAFGFVLGSLASRVASSPSGGSTATNSFGGTTPKPSIFSELVDKLVDRVGSELRSAGEKAIQQATSQVRERVDSLLEPLTKPI